MSAWMTGPQVESACFKPTHPRRPWDERMPSMLRFFLALTLPDEAKDRLVAVQPPPGAGMRVLGRDELHLTLHFLGELTPQHEEVLHKALPEMKANAFTISI